MTTLSDAHLAAAEDLCAFVAASPSPYHAAREAARRLGEAGFTALDEREVWSFEPGDRRYVERGGTLVAFIVGEESPAVGGFRVIGAHTDSPNLRLKPKADVVKSGYRQLGVEPYGGVIFATWLDRDLSVAGRALVLEGGRVRARLVDFEAPITRIPNAAIHLNRSVNTEGLILNQQKHLAPILGLGDEGDFQRRLAERLGVAPTDVLGHDLGLYDTLAPTLGGDDRELVFSARLDNLGSSHAATVALAGLADKAAATRVIALYDHEECGSRSAEGAAGSVLRDVLGRICDAHADRAAQGFARSIARSLLISADMAHAVHPNYADLHEPEHQPRLNQGLVIKSNSNQSYATNGETAARFTAICREVGYAPQRFVTRSDLPCGTTIGPITAAKLGIPTVDVGAPMLSMHSCREMCGAADVLTSIQTFKAAFSAST